MGDDELSMDRICRGCLREENEMFSLFAIQAKTSDNILLSQMLISSTQIQVMENDGLPCKICSQCTQKLHSAFTFKHMCEKSDARLKKLVSGVNCNSEAQDTSSTDVKQETTNVSMSNDIIDFNSMFNSDLPSIKTEREQNETKELKLPNEDGSLNNVTSTDEKSCQVQLEEILKIHNCPGCQRKFSSMFGLTAHLKKHKNTHVMSCSKCAKIFANERYLKRHQSENHTSSIKEKSDLVTPAADSHAANEQTNLTLDHRKKKNYSCVYCGRGFYRIANYEDHMKSCKAKTHPCLSCDAVYDKLDDLLAHLKSLHGITKESLGEEEKCTVEMEKNVFVNGENASPPGSPVLPTAEPMEPNISIKEEPLDDLLDEAERENLLDAKDDPDDFMEDIHDDFSEDMPSDDEEYFGYNFNPKRRPRGRPKKLITTVKKCKVRKIRSADDGEATGPMFPCTMCPKVLASKKTHKIHMARHTGEGVIYSCVVCKQTFSRRAGLKRHELIHGTIKRYKCDTCDKAFKREDHLKKHMWQHSDQKPFVCDICTKGFLKPEQLERHKYALHSGKEKNPKTTFCPICNRGFTTEKYLDTHMRMHTGDKTFTCKVCDKSFNSKWHLKEHTKWHSAEKPFLCSECGQRFIRNDYLVIHMRRHKGDKPYKCKFCGKGFPRATDLTVHERYHTGEKTHLCTICGKGFQRQYNLTVHLRVHTGEKPYVCTYCGKRFAQGNDLKSHVRRHTGERYNCEVCGEGFIQGYHLTQHKRSVHGINCMSHIRRVEKHPPPPPASPIKLTEVK